MSARQLAQVTFGDEVARALHDAGVEPGRIHLEITEGALMHDVSSAWAVLRQAKALGVKLALDDFGTGYSSLSYIRRFSLDMLKIDKSFIDGIDSSPEDRAIVEHVVGMATSLGMITVAEGVERTDQVAWLRRLGCKLIQGYVMSRPIPGEELEAILRDRPDDPFGATTMGVAKAAPIAAAHSGAAVAGSSSSAGAAPPAGTSSPTVGPLLVPATVAAGQAATADQTGLERPLVAVAATDLNAEPVPAATSASPDSSAGPATTTPRRSAGPSLPRLREFRPPES